MSEPRLLVSASPHLGGPDSTPRIMWTVNATLVPVLLLGMWFFGPSALLVVGAATVGALIPERLMGRPGALRDGSALITGLLLGLTLPPALPLWMAFVGGVFAVVFGKLVFGGLGQNVFNPALLGRAFLQAAFPVALTTWPSPGQPWSQMLRANFAAPLMSADMADTVTEATPLGLMKFERTLTDVPELLLGTTGGCVGETSALLILLCGGYLAFRGYLNWRIPVSIFATVAVLATVLHLVNAERYPGPFFMLFSGGLVLGAVYMATDMVTSPVSSRGCLIYGAGIGALVVIIRMWGGLAEGVMYAILLMNALVPFIDRVTRPRVFGTAPTGGGA